MAWCAKDRRRGWGLAVVVFVRDLLLPVRREPVRGVGRGPAQRRVPRVPLQAAEGFAAPKA